MTFYRARNGPENNDPRKQLESGPEGPVPSRLHHSERRASDRTAALLAL
jgi:hypothetical protein